MRRIVRPVLAAGAVLLLGTALLVTNSVPAAGQPADQPKGIPSVEPRLQNVGENLPCEDHLTKLTIKEFDREIRIHRSTNLDATRKGVYFHQPLLALIPRPESPKSKTADKFPAIVHAAYPLPDGTAVKLVFKVALTTEGIRSAAARAVQNADAEFLKKENIRGDQIEIRKWPVQRMVVDCAVGDDLLGTALTPSLLAVGDNLEFGLTLTKDRHDKLVSALKADPELVRFTFAYTFANTEVGVGSIELRASKTTAAAITSVLASDNKNNVTMGLKDGTVTQTTKDRIVREVVMSLSRTVRASGPRVLDALKGGATDQVAMTLFPQLATELPLTALNEEREKALAAYLAPLIQSVKEDTVRNDSTTDEKGKDKTRKETFKMGTHAGAKFKDCGIDVNNEDEVVLTEGEHEKLTKLSGVTFTENKEDKFFRPSTINTFKMVEGWQTVQVDAKDYAILGVGRSELYLEQTPITAAYRTDRIPTEFSANPTTTGYYDGVPLGTMLPYFANGDQPPKGYVFADSKTNWPTEEWVPLHLRGKPVPDMSGLLMGSTVAVAEVGVPFLSGELPASGLSITEGKEHPWDRYAKVKVGEVELFQQKKFKKGNEPSGWTGKTGDRPVYPDVPDGPRDGVSALNVGYDEVKRVEKEVTIRYEDWAKTYEPGVKGSISLAGPNRKLNPPNMQARWIIKMR